MKFVITTKAGSEIIGGSLEKTRMLDALGQQRTERFVVFDENGMSGLSPEETELRLAAMGLRRRMFPCDGVKVGLSIWSAYGIAIYGTEPAL